VTDIAAWDILTWVLLVLLAGFIGQFGKSFAQAVMARMRKKKADAAFGSGPAGPSGTAGPGGSGALPAPDGPRRTMGRAVVDGSGEAEPSPEGLPAPESGMDKKALKALAKQEKKEAKLLDKRSK
jgi:hypothetical protein